MRLSLIYILISTLIVTACKQQEDQTNEDNTVEKTTISSLQGKYIRVANNDRAGVEKYVTIIKEIEFKGSHCHFKYLGTPMSGKFEVDEGFVYISTGGELGMLSLEVIDGDQLEGEGFIHGTFKREGTFDPSILEPKRRNSTTDYTKPKSIREPEETNEEKVSTTINEPSYSNNPFSSNSSSNSSPFGDGGTENAASYGNGAGSGDSGNGLSTTKRTRLNDVQLDDLNYNQDVTIYLMLNIDASGKIVSINHIAGKSTTTDQNIINRVKMAVKNQVKYSKDPGASLTTVYYTIRINAN